MWRRVGKWENDQCVGIWAQWVEKLQAGQSGSYRACCQVAEETRDDVCDTWSLRPKGVLRGWSLRKNPFPEQPNS